MVCGAAVGGALACSADTTSSDDGSGFTVHCVFDLGDATCQAAFPSKPFCNTCQDKSQSLGCSANVPPPGCMPDGATLTDTGEDSGDAESSSDGTTSDDPSTTTGPEPDTGADESSTTEVSISCEEEGQLDEDCERADPSRPYCINATCVGCDAVGGDPFCSSIDATLPVCDPSTTVCLGCEMGGAEFCGGDTPVCDLSGACRACSAHAECPGTACHLAPDDPAAGSCFGEDEVVWVDRDAICPGTGTENNPSCSLAATLAALPVGGNAVVALMGGAPYDEHVVADGDITVAILGTAGVPELVGEPGLDDASLSVGNARVYAQGVRIASNAESHGIACGGGTIWLDLAEVRQNADYGIYLTSPCDVTLRNAGVHNNPGGGIRQLGGALVLDNALVGQNGDGAHGPGINLQYADLTAIYATIAGNDGVGSDSIQCLDSTGTVRNSIVTGASAVSIDLDCFVLDFETNAVDTATFGGPESAIVAEYDDFWFIDPDAGDFRLANPPFTPFGDVALWEDGDPPIDADGTARPQGGELGYAGVDEP
jgi:hypothetical protein